MEIFSRKIVSAVEAVIYIACHPGTEPVRSRDICAYQDVPLRYLEPMLQKLVRAGILRGVRGPKGGYLLAKERRKIKMTDIAEALQNGEGGDPLAVRSDLRKKITEPIWLKCKAAAIEPLNGFSLQDLVDKAINLKLDALEKPKSDFTI